MILLFLLNLITGLLEIFSINSLLSNQFLLAWMIHFSTALLLTVAYQFFLQTSFERVPKLFGLLMLILILFIPFFGKMISFFIVYSLNRYHEHYHQYSELCDDSINLDRMDSIHPTYGAGGAAMHLLQTDNPLTKRCEALFRVSKNQLSAINPLMTRLLPDNSDEIRLLAFNILEQQEHTITQKIDELLNRLAEDHLTAVYAAHCHKNLALLYWELIYNHLVSPEMAGLLVNKAEINAVAAGKVLTEDAGIWILLGKIYKHLHEYAQAEAAFQTATALHASPSQLLPYLAEINYIQGDYQAMRAYLQESDALLDIALIAPVKRFWDKL